jgi:hypothetical protein
MTNKYISPCLDCGKRTVGCHGECKKYGLYAGLMEAENAEILAYKKRGYDIDEVHHKSIYGRHR